MIATGLQLFGELVGSPKFRVSDDSTEANE